MKTIGAQLRAHGSSPTDLPLRELHSTVGSLMVDRCLPPYPFGPRHSLYSHMGRSATRGLSSHPITSATVLVFVILFLLSILLFKFNNLLSI